MSPWYVNMGSQYKHTKAPIQMQHTHQNDLFLSTSFLPSYLSLRFRFIIENYLGFSSRPSALDSFSALDFAKFSL